MALKAIYDNQDDIPEAHLELFKENSDGKWEIQVVGVKTQADIDRQARALTKEREDHAKAKDALKRWTALGDDPEKIQLELDTIEELKAAAGDKIDDKKLDEMVERRLASKTAPLERELKNKKDDLLALEQQLQQFKQKDISRTINDTARQAADKAKIRPEAVDDFLLLAGNVLTLNEDGKVVVKDNVGFTPGVGPEEILDDLKDRKPHWWGESQGGGAGGSSGGGTSGDDPFAKDTWNITKQAQLFKENPERAKALAAKHDIKL